MQIFTVCLLHEMGKGKSSWWHPYLIHMPRSYDLLSTFCEFHVKALQVRCFLFSHLKNLHQLIVSILSSC